MSEDLISDEELARLEQELGRAHALPETELDEDLQALEAEILAMEGDAPPHPEPVVAPPPAPAAAPLLARGQLTGPEEELHGLACYFGACIDAEVSDVIPRLRDTFASAAAQEEVSDFFLCLDRKSASLLRLKATVLSKVESGEIAPQRFVAALEKCIAHNKSALKVAIERFSESGHIQRIQQRVKLITDELATAPCGTPRGEATPQQRAVGNMRESPRQPATSLRDGPVQPRDSVPGPAAVQLAVKIARCMAFNDYLRKNFVRSRAKEEAPALIARIEKMKGELKKVKSGKARTLDDIDAEFPDLTPEEVIGEPRAQRDQKIRDTLLALKAEIDSVSERSLKAIYAAHYVRVFKALKAVLDSEYGIAPRLVRKPVVFPHPASTPRLLPGHLLLQPLSIAPVKAGRRYYLSFELHADDAAWKFDSSYCTAKGAFEYEKVIDFGARLPPRLHRQAFAVALHKRKFLISSKIVATATLPLARLATLCEFRESAVFRRKSGSVVTAEVGVAARKALGKSHKQIDLVCIAEEYPILYLQASMAPSEQPSFADASKAGSISSEKSIEAHTADAPASAPVAAIDVLEKAEFRYPLIPAELKAKLHALITDQKLGEGFSRFEDSLLCVTFLEEFVAELEKQIALLNCKGDFATSKNAQKLLISAQGKLSSLCASVEAGKMTPGEYCAYLTGRVEEEKKLLAFYQKAGIESGVTFLQNRLHTLKDEVAKLEQS